MDLGPRCCDPDRPGKKLRPLPESLETPHGLWEPIVVLCLASTVVCGVTSVALGRTALFVVALVILLLMMTVARSATEQKHQHPTTVWLFPLGAATLVISFLVGMCNYCGNWAPYLAATGGRKYTQVGASDPAETHRDAGILEFVQGTGLKMLASVGWKGSGHTYCVAPVVDEALETQPEVQFWAVGFDCCEARSDFHCDDSGNSGALSGVVSQWNEHVVTALLPDHREQFLAAIRLAAAAHSMEAAHTPILLRWVESTSGTVSSYLMWAILTFFVGSTLVAALVSCGWWVVHTYYERRIRRALHETEARLDSQEAQGKHKEPANVEPQWMSSIMDTLLNPWDAEADGLRSHPLQKDKRALVRERSRAAGTQ